MADPIIRVLTADEVDQAVAWATAEGWNPGLADAPVFRAVDPDGFIGLVLPDGTLAASISVVRYGEAFGFLGFYIVRPDQRGRGYGWRLWQAGMAHLGARSVGLDGVVAQQDAYRRSGFAFAHRNVRFGGPLFAAGPRHPALMVPEGALVDAVAAYDAPLFPAPRAGFVRDWLAGPSRRALAYVEGGAVRGYGVIRPCREGAKIGPLFADTPDVAAAIARGLAGVAARGPVFLDAPEPNGAAVALAANLGLSPVFETARMYKGPAPALDLARVYGITTFELG